MRDQDLFRFIKERYSIFLKKEAGEPKPWTKDPILQKFKFTNVHRENDRVTKWIAENWRTPNKTVPDLWFAMCVARYVNWPDSLKDIGFPVPWRPLRFKSMLRKRIDRKQQLFTGAYIVHSLGPKILYLADRVFTPLWESRFELRPKREDTLAKWFEKLHSYRGMGSFMAAQVVADIKYAEPLKSAEDWWTWAAMGPGSARGLNRVCNVSKNDSWDKKEWLSQLNILQTHIDPKCKAEGIPRLHAQDLQNCLCEFDKMERVRLGEGRPRSLYPGT